MVFSYIDQYAKDNNIGVSLIDKRVLSATYTANGYVVTDDVDMQSVAAAFGIKVIYGGEESQKRTGFDVCSWRRVDY